MLVAIVEMHLHQSFRYFKFYQDHPDVAEHAALIVKMYEHIIWLLGFPPQTWIHRLAWWRYLNNRVGNTDNPVILITMEINTLNEIRVDNLDSEHNIYLHRF